MRHLFPFDAVEKNSKIIIFGAGYIGKQFLAQIEELNYCQCICFADINYKGIKQVNNIEVIAQEEIANCDYDKIVIASHKYIDEIYQSLVDGNIPQGKIANRKITSLPDIEKPCDADRYVYISDYEYIPRFRASLSESRIADMMNDWWNDKKGETLALLKKFCAHTEAYQKIPLNQNDITTPKWKNNYITPFDALSIYGFLAVRNPRYYVEVGSGNTTLFAVQSIRDNNLRTKVISIDPSPRAEIDALCDKVYRKSLVDMDISFFATLTDEDVFLLDGSHRTFPNSDVTVYFTEIVPVLPAGLLYTMHDIFLPYDYPEKWITRQRRWYNEQYMLAAYLLGGANGDKIICPNQFLGTKAEVTDACSALWGKGGYLEDTPLGGGFFWMEKR